MTVQEAAQNLADKKALFDQANQKATQADADLTNANSNYQVVVQENAHRLAEANQKIQDATSAKIEAFTESQQARTNWSQARLDLNAAMEALEQGATEKV